MYLRHAPRRAARRLLAGIAALALVFNFSTSWAEDFKLAEIAPGVFVHQGHVALYSPKVGGDISNCGFVIGRESVAVVDTCGSEAVAVHLRDAIRKATDKPIRYVIMTHMHPDHVLGGGAFVGDGVTYVGHKKLARALAARAERYMAANRELMGEAAFAGSRIIPPTLAVDDRLELDLGDRKLELTAWPTAHTDNDLTVFDQQTSTLFLGDLLFSRHVPALDGSLRGWLKVMTQLEAIKAARVVPGHGPASLDWPAALAPQRRYLSRIADDVRAAIKSGKTLAEASKEAGLSEKDAWALFDEFNPRNVSAAFAELEWE